MVSQQQDLLRLRRGEHRTRPGTPVCPNCGVIHDRNENAARNLQKLALLAVGEDVMLLDGETAPAEGRTEPRTVVNSQLRLAL